MKLPCGVEGYISVNVDTKLPLNEPLCIVGLEPVMFIEPFTLNSPLIEPDVAVIPPLFEVIPCDVTNEPK